MTNRFKSIDGMEPDEQGGYVLHADYKALEKYNEELKSEYEHVMEYLIQKDVDNIQLIKEALKAWEDKANLADD